MKNQFFALLILSICLLTGHLASAFCGFYVAKTDAKLFNNTSQVILVRDGNKTVVTMSSDFVGSVKDFAMVVPVPQVIKREDIRIANQNIFDKLDAYSGPRLVEYYDANPCSPPVMKINEAKRMVRTENDAPSAEMIEDAEEYNVKIEASYAVGEYDILVLSAQESDGLKKWLIANGYKIPAKAERVLEPYIKSGMKFFVVKVNLEAHKVQGFSNLRPLQIGFQSEKFMLPIRLGMANSNAEQDMIVYALTRNGRVETANYRMLEMPTAREIPTFIKPKFGQFYKDLFEKTHQSTGRKSVFLEYAWDVTPSWNGVKCDPCVGPPPVNQDMLSSGVWWLREANPKVFFTRMHVRYSEKNFPQDLFFISTPNTTKYQARYVMRHGAGGELTCDEGKKYKSNLKLRRQKELRELEALTDWNVQKYTKYVANGTGEIDERKNEFLPAGTPSDSAPPRWPLYMLVFVFVGLGVVNFFGQRVSG